MPRPIRTSRKHALGPLADSTEFLLRLVPLQQGEAFRPVDLSPQQYSIMALCEYAPGQTQAVVAGTLRILRPNMVVQLRKLEKRKLVERRGPPGKERFLHLTKSGSTSLQKARRADGRIESGLKRKLGARGHEQLLSLLRKLADLD